MDFSSINWLAVIVAGLAAWGLGAIWYMPLFGKIWRRETGMEDVKPSSGTMAKTSLGSFFLMTVMALGLAICLPVMHSVVDVKAGMQTGILMGTFFSITTMGINYLYQSRSLTLYAIDALYTIVFMGLQGIILAAWQ